MKKNVKISVVMGVYNPLQKEYFFRAVFDCPSNFPDWELILYDDGSDGTAAAIIRQAAKA